ncbi:MAG: hypothetical protein JXR77_13195, partial [Lentisphaeria bacterium]|nr:hypothetical protein [Lentisphaeria bacterium]
GTRRSTSGRIASEPSYNARIGMPGHRNDAADESRVDYAIDMWRDPEKHSSEAYGAGPKAYDNWTRAVPDSGSSHGNWCADRRQNGTDAGHRLPRRGRRQGLPERASVPGPR